MKYFLFFDFILRGMALTFDLNDFAVSQENVSVVGRTGFLLSISVNIYFWYSVYY